jgi:Tektin family
LHRPSYFSVCHCHCEAWCKLNELIEVRFKLKIDIEDKREAEDIDSEQMALNKDCSTITYKVDPLRVARNSCTYNGWLSNCKELKLLSDKELKESYAVRESLFVAREKTKNLLAAQQEKTEHTIRRRIFETQRQRNELSWQKMKVSEKFIWGRNFRYNLSHFFVVTRLPRSAFYFFHIRDAISQLQSDARRIRKSCARDKRLTRDFESQG